MDAKTTQPLLVMTEINKAFPGVQALQDVNLSIEEGEVHGVVGKNGAGKSTLMAILMGILPADRGTISIGGHVYTTWTPQEALNSGVAYVPQRINMMNPL